MITIKLTNTLTKTKIPLQMQGDLPVSLYVCGITPYDFAHIGHGRVYVTFDVLVRLLRFLGKKVTYVRNVTDIDDKLLNKAQATGDRMAYKQIADHFTQAFQDDMTKLGCLVPSAQPQVTECIPEIIDFIKGLVAKNHAYVIDQDVYFDVLSFPSYGKLSGRKLDDLLAGARVDVDERKKNPADFVLWKGNKEGQFWQSPWGYGRPGWHIECSVMAKKFLGTTIDIHGGGMDLIFPHHENEIAQSEALHEQPFATLWMHNAFVNINKEKMSKSLGNIVALKAIFEKHDPMVLRFYYLQHHYKTPIDYSDQDIDAATTAYKRLVHTFQGVQTMESATVIETIDERIQAMLTALADDLNTTKFLGLVFEHLSECRQNAQFAGSVKTLITQILGLSLQPIAEQLVDITPEIMELVEQRERARKDKNWTLADQIRDELAKHGYSAKDKKL